MKATDRAPSLMFTILNGGKDAGSKVKFTKFFVILNMTVEDEFDPVEIYFKLTAAIEKGVSATKAGLAAFKKGSPDGAYFNAYDNIGECFKMLEEAIASLGVNSEQRQPLKIGVSCDAQNWYIEDQAKYEWDGPKAQFDVNQLIEFYQKMCTEHPLLEIIEDSFAKSDVKGVKKFIEKLKESHPAVRVGINTMFESNLETIKEFTQLIQEESDEEEE
jgi:enolase